MLSLGTEMLLSNVVLARYQRRNTCGYHLLAYTTLYKQRSRSIYRIIDCRSGGFGPT